jgi:translin
MMDQFTTITEKARKIFEERTAARDQALVQARQLTRLCAHTIRAIHRSESQPAHELLNEAHQLVKQMKADLLKYPDLYYAGYTQDAIKEFSEASLTCAIIENMALPTPEDLDMEYNTYVNGLAECIGELRRRCLDILRQGYSEDAERLLNAMDEIYNFLVTMDYPDAVTNGLRRQTDLVRGIIERTRADLTMSLRQQHLQEALIDFGKRFPEK